MHGKSRAKKAILGHRVRKARNNVRKVRKKKGLIKRKTRGYIQQGARETQEHIGHEVREAQGMQGTRKTYDMRHMRYESTQGTRHAGHEARRARGHVEYKARRAGEHVRHVTQQTRFSAGQLFFVLLRLLVYVCIAKKRGPCKFFVRNHEVDNVPEIGLSYLQNMPIYYPSRKHKLI